MADMLLTDPPYNVSLGQTTGHPMRPSEAKQLKRRTDGLVIENDSFETDEEFIDFLTAAFNASMPHIIPGGVFYVWHADNQSHNFRTACRMSGMKVRQNLVWVKSTFALGRQDYQWRHEPCLYGWKDGAGHNWYGGRKESTVLEYSKPTNSKLHPTMKPVELVSYLVRNSSKMGELVLDPFGGSGSTLIACELTGRRCCTMELDPHYCDVIIERWQNLTGREAVLVEEARDGD